ncbi:MAG: hypothetical protein HZB13_13640 [Acidobacteria bacterium]|nr:hypothetical protein [Acidobacteriota bacterium]
MDRGPGDQVHAALFPRRRELVLEASLRRRPAELARIVTHEYFHLVWIRLGNPARRQWEAVLLGELAAGARGELGWSAEWRKGLITLADRTARSRRWRLYACESFCDTAAFLYAGIPEHEEFTLRPRFRFARQSWFRTLERHLGGVFRV